MSWLLIQVETKTYLETRQRWLGIEKKVLGMIHNFWSSLIIIILKLVSSAFINYLYIYKKPIAITPKRCKYQENWWVSLAWQVWGPASHGGAGSGVLPLQWRGGRWGPTCGSAVGLGSCRHSGSGVSRDFEIFASSHKYSFRKHLIALTPYPQISQTIEDYILWFIRIISSSPMNFC